MKLLNWIIDDWRDVVSHSYAFWLTAAGIALLLLQMLGYTLFGLELDPYWVGWTALFLQIAAMVLRVVKQPGSRRMERIKVIVVVILAGLLALLAVPRAFAEPATEAQTMAILLPLAKAQEGLSLRAYKPFSWDRWTICYGATEGVTQGMTATEEECTARLRETLAHTRTKLHQFYEPHVIESLLPPTRDAAYSDLGYNCGWRRIGRSTAVRQLNAGDVAGGCEALTWWNKGGGRILIGLVHRRKREYRLCMEGVQ